MKWKLTLSVAVVLFGFAMYAFLRVLPPSRQVAGVEFLVAIVAAVMVALVVRMIIRIRREWDQNRALREFRRAQAKK